MLSIGTFSKISQVTTNTLRYYDEIGLIKPVHVNKESGYRFYDVEQLKTILFISRLKQYFFSLDEIGEILKKPYDNDQLSVLILQKQRELHEKVSLHQLILKQMQQDIDNLERGIPIMSYLDQIEVKLTETAPMNILFFREIINVEDYGKYIGKLFERIARDKLTVNGHPMSIFHDDQHNPSHYDMEIAVPVKEVVKGTREFPGLLCASATLKGAYSGLPSIYAKIKQWTESEGFTLSASPFEIYLTDPRGSLSPDEYITEVYFPVKK